MRLLHIDLLNFKQYRSLSLDFADGLTGIVGSNGSGKSTLFDAVRCALFGEIPFIKEHLRSADAGRSDPVSVELSFESGGKKYRAVREFRGAQLAPQAKLYEEGSEECIATQQDSVTERIESILGMSGDAFIHSVFSEQKELGKISEATGAKRRELVREMLGMSRIDEVQKLVREEANDRISQIKSFLKIAKSPEEIEALSLKKTSLEEQISGVTLKISEADKKVSASEKLYNSANTLFEEQHKLSAEYTSYKSKRDKAALEAQNNIKRRDEITQELEKLTAEKSLLGKQIDLPSRLDDLKNKNESFIALKNIHIKRTELEKQLKSKRQEYSDQTIRKQSLENELSSYAPQLAESASLKAKKESLESELKHTEESMQTASAREGEIRSKRDERAGYKKQLSALGKDADCPMCKRPLAEQYDSVLKNLSDEIETYEKKELTAAALEKEKLSADKKRLISEINEMLNQIKNVSKIEGISEEKQKQLKETLSRIEIITAEGDSLKKELAAMDSSAYDEKAHRDAEQKLKETSALHDEYLRTMERIKRIPVLEKESAQLDAEHTQNLKTAAEEESNMRGCGFKEESYNASLEQRTIAHDESEKARKAKDALTEEIHLIEKSLQSTVSELAYDAGTRERSAALETERNTFQRLTAIFDGFKNAILARVQPSIASSASGLFSQMTDGRYGEIIVDENFDFHISDGGERYPIKRFSGGEIDLANLCLRIAISRAIRSLSGGGTSGFLGFDEIFGSQDAERRHTVMDALNRLSDEYNQIFIVSHVDDVKDEFPNMIEVTRGADGAKASYR